MSNKEFSEFDAVEYMKDIKGLNLPINIQYDSINGLLNVIIDSHDNKASVMVSFVSGLTYVYFCEYEWHIHSEHCLKDFFSNKNRFDSIEFDDLITILYYLKYKGFFYR